MWGFPRSNWNRKEFLREKLHTDVKGWNPHPTLQLLWEMTSMSAPKLGREILPTRSGVPAVSYLRKYILESEYSVGKISRTRWKWESLRKNQSSMSCCVKRLWGWVETWPRDSVTQLRNFRDCCWLLRSPLQFWVCWGTNRNTAINKSINNRNIPCELPPNLIMLLI